MEAQGQAETQQAQAQLVASQALASGVGSAYTALRSFAQSTAAAIGHATCSGIDSAAGNFGKFTGSQLGDKEGVQQWLLDHVPNTDPKQKKYDGDVIGKGCTPNKGQSPTDVQGFRTARQV